MTNYTENLKALSNLVKDSFTKDDFYKASQYLGCFTKDLRLTENVFDGIIPPNVISVPDNPSNFYKSDTRNNIRYNGLNYCKFIGTNVKFCIYNKYFDDGAHFYPSTYCIYEKGTLLKLRKLASKYYNNQSKICEPILDDGVLDDLVRNTIGFLKHKRYIENLGGILKRGILLTGTYGCGKTLSCDYLKKLASKKNISYRIIDASDIEGAFNNGNLANLMTTSPLIFLDDIDISYFSRKQGSDSKIACSLLSALDGVNKEHKACVRIFTTNEEVDGMDKAFLRPGRIDRIFKIGRPSAQSRRKLIESWHENVLKHIDIDELVKKTHDYSMAEIDDIKNQILINLVTMGKPHYILYGTEKRQTFGFQGAKISDENNTGFRR